MIIYELVAQKFQSVLLVKEVKGSGYTDSENIIFNLLSRLCDWAPPRAFTQVVFLFFLLQL